MVAPTRRGGEGNPLQGGGRKEASAYYDERKGATVGKSASGLGSGIKEEANPGHGV